MCWQLILNGRYSGRLYGDILRREYIPDSHGRFTTCRVEVGDAFVWEQDGLFVRDINVPTTFIPIG